jgi:hypothetical protein
MAALSLVACTRATKTDSLGSALDGNGGGQSKSFPSATSFEKVSSSIWNYNVNSFY